MSANPVSPATPRPEEYPPMGGEHYWARASQELRSRLAKAIPHEVLKELHRKSPARHLAIAARQFAILIAASAISWLFREPWIWIPAAVVAGWTIFNFTILLHEVVHRAVWNGPRPRADRLLALLYAIPSGISALQFTRWHLTHHAELGDYEADPKRHYLSPKINKPWFKLLYFTPALFPIYFRAAALETASYPPNLRRRIAWERRGTILFHIAVMAAILWAGGAGTLARVYLVPYFLVFPIAFALNRMGQHYYVNPANPAQWSTLVKSSLFWNFAFLWSNFHLEHHYFPRVPFYNLPRLHRLLKPFYRSEGMKPVGYGTLIYGWLIRNGAPHTNWSLV